MKKRITLFITSCFMALGAMAESVCVSTPTTSLVVDATKGKELTFMYYCARISDADLKTLSETGGSAGQFGTLSAYPAYGYNCANEYALSVVHSNGDMALQLLVDGVEQRDGGVTVELVL